MPAALGMDLIAVWHISRSPDPGAWGRRDHVIANKDAVLTLDDIERFVLAMMHMERRYGALWTCHFDSTEYAVGIARRRENHNRLLEEPDRNPPLQVEMPSVRTPGPGFAPVP